MRPVMHHGPHSWAQPRPVRRGLHWDQTGVLVTHTPTHAHTMGVLRLTEAMSLPHDPCPICQDITALFSTFPAASAGSDTSKRRTRQ
jgi:hypothetical protein